MIKVQEFISELKRWQIFYFLDANRRLALSGGDKNARAHYQKILQEYPELEANLILEMAKHSEDLMFELEERAAIREAEGLPGDLFSAVMCRMCP